MDIIHLSPSLIGHYFLYVIGYARLFIYMLYAERKVDELYGCKHFDKDTPSYRVSHWGSVENQEDNFRRVADIISECGDVNSILDVGCGMGTIKQFLPKIKDYTGIDSEQSVVSLADSKDISFADIANYEPNRKFDAVVCCGSFNMGVEMRDVLTYLKRMESLSSIITILTISYLEVNPLRESDLLKLAGYIQTTTMRLHGDDYVFYKLSTGATGKIFASPI